MDLTIVNAEVGDLGRNMADNAPERQAAIFVRLTERLRAAGAEAVAMASRIYGGISAVDLVAPEGRSFDATHEAYVAMAAAAQATEHQRDVLFAIGRELCSKQGAEAVLLAGTDLFLAFEGRDCGFPTIDGALVHVEALARATMR